MKPVLLAIASVLVLALAGSATADIGIRETRLWAPPYLLLGSIRQWRRLPNGHGVGHLSFRVPRVARGPYVLGLFCGDCVRGPKGSLIIDHRLVLRVK